MFTKKVIPRIIIGKCVWGDAYTQTMLRLNIPSLLSKKNIGSLSGYHIEHHIYTTPADRDKIETDPFYLSLARQIECRIITPNIETIVDDAPYDATIARMNAYHHRIIEDCAEKNAMWLFDQPDHVWGDGSLRHLVDLAYDGWDTVFFPGVRTNKAEISVAIEPWRSENSGAIEIPHRRLVDLALKHMHFHDLTRFWGPLIATAWPHHIAWRVAPGCFMRRSFYPQPFLINTRNRPHLIRSIDFSYIETAIESGDRVHFISDSDDFFLVEVSDKFRFLDYSVNRMSMEIIGNWAIRYASKAHCKAFANSVLYHTDTISPKRMRRINRFAESISHAVSTITDLDRAATSMVLEHPRAATFIRLCLSHDMLIRRVTLPHPFTLKLPLEADVPDPEALRGPLSHSEIDVIIEWIGRHILPANSARSATGSEAEIVS